MTLRRENRSSSSSSNGWKWTSFVTNRDITNMTKATVMPPSAISTALNPPSWTAPLQHSLFFPAGMSHLPCLRAVSLRSHHEIYFVLCFCRSSYPLALKLDSIIWRTQSTSPPLFMALSEKTPAGHSSGLSVFCSSFYRPPTKKVSSFSIYSPLNAAT